MLTNKKTPILLVVLSVVSVCCLIVVYIGINTALGNANEKRMQESLAKQLGVRIEDYPSPIAFPIGYFETVLTPGMTINEVHQIVQGYEQVFHCEDVLEIYYYYSSDDDRALRFEVFFDDQRRFLGLRGEDTNSRSIRIEGCETGPFKE